MAITNNGVKVSVGAAYLPADYTKPAVTTFTDAEYERRLVLEVDKATVHDSDPATTMDNIINNGTVGVKKQVDDILAADYVNSNTVTAYADLLAIGNNMENMKQGSDAYTDAATKYLCSIVLYVKTA